MNVAIFTNNYLPNPYGVSGSIESFRKQLEALGHTVYVFAPSFKGYVDENKRVFRYPAIDLKFKNIRFPIAISNSCLGGRRAYRIGRLLEKLEIEVIHAQHPNLLGWEARRWAKRKNVPLIFTWHTLYDQYAHFAPIIPSKLAAWWAIGNARKYANRADQVIVPTASVQKIIRAWGVSNENLTVVPTGINEKQFENFHGSEIRQKYAVGEAEILLVVITRFTKEKNSQFLFEAVAKVLQKNKQVKFLAGGDGDLLETLKDIAAEKNIAGQVIFAGFVPNEIKKDYYAAGDIFVFASKSETQGMIISEAMYAGLPVVAVDGPGVRDMVTNQVTGLLTEENEAEFAAAVERLIKDKALRQKFAENAGKIARQFYTATVCAQKLLAVYEQAIMRKKEKERQ